jgi:hypothetical protein
MRSTLGLSACVGSILVVGALATAQVGLAGDDTPPAKTGVDAKAAFAKIKTLKGTWKSAISDEAEAGAQKKHDDAHKGDSAVTYKLTGAGSALVETQFPGAAHEMVSVYHLDGDDLRMTHYCAAGNQPHVKLDKEKSTAEDLVFVFDGGTNLDPKKDMHIHGLRITFHKDGTVTSAWDGYAEGKKVGTTKFVLTRE